MGIQNTKIWKAAINNITLFLTSITVLLRHNISISYNQLIKMEAQPQDKVIKTFEKFLLDKKAATISEAKISPEEAKGNAMSKPLKRHA
jgi:hypothetical protein